MPLHFLETLLDGHGLAFVSDAFRNIERAVSLAFVSDSSAHAHPVEVVSGAELRLRPHFFSSFFTGSEGADAVPHGDNVWTFAYGSNIGRSKLRSLGIDPKTTLPAVLPKHSLVFDGELGANGHLGGHKFFNQEEQAFANVRQLAQPNELAPAVGVVHEITPEELKVLDKSESPIMHRELMTLQVDGKNGIESVPAWTYVSKDYDSNAKPDLKIGHYDEHAPSARYARLVVCGAEEQALPRSYLSKLRHHLKQLGLPEDSLDCSKPLVPLAAQDNLHVKASWFPMIDNKMFPLRERARVSKLAAMGEFLFPTAPIEVMR